MADDFSRLLEEQRRTNSLLTQVLGQRVTTSGGGGSGGDWQTGASNAGNLFTQAGRTAVDAMGKVASGTASTSDVLGAATGVIGKFGGIGADAGKAIQELGTGVIDANNAMRRTGDVGVTFSGNLGEMNKQVKQAQLTMPEFEDAIRRNSGAIAGLSSTMDKSASAYLKVSKDVQETGVADTLKQAGISSKEFAELTMLSIQNKRALDLNDDKARKQAIETTLALANEMNEVARITGKSREEQQRMLKGQLEKAEVEASLAQMGNEGRDNFNKMQVALGPLGKSVQDLASEIATGGVRTAEGTKQMAALGPAGASLERAIKQQMEARTDDEKKRAAQAVESAKLDVLRYQQSKEYLDAVRFDSSEVGKVRRQQYMDSLASQKADEAAREEYRKKFGKDGTAEEVAKFARDQVKMATAGVEIDPKTGKEIVNQGAVVSRTINQLDNLGKVAAGGAAEGLNKLNRSTGELIQSQQGFNNFLAKYKTAEAAANLPRDTANAATQALTGRQAANSANLPPDRRNPVPIREFGSPGVDSFLKGSGAFSNMFENWGKETVVKLHGEEAVVRKDQGIQLVQKLVDEQSGNLKKQLDGVVKKVAADKATVNREDLQKEVAQAFSKITSTNNEMPGINRIGNDITNAFGQMSQKITSGPKLDVMQEQMTKAFSQIKQPEFTKLPMSKDIFGSLTSKINDLTSNIPKSDATNKPKEEPRVSPETQVATPPAPPAPIGEEVTLKDILQALNELNKTNALMVANTEMISEFGRKQLQATKGLSGNRLA